MDGAVDGVSGDVQQRPLIVPVEGQVNRASAVRSAGWRPAAIASTISGARKASGIGLRCRGIGTGDDQAHLDTAALDGHGNQVGDSEAFGNGHRQGQGLGPEFDPSDQIERIAALSGEGIEKSGDALRKKIGIAGGIGDGC